MDGQTVAPPGLNLVNVGALCTFYITILPIIAISEILQCENDEQFIIHCSKSLRRLHLIEFVLCFVAGCLSHYRGGGVVVVVVVGVGSHSGHPRVGVGSRPGREEGVHKNHLHSSLHRLCLTKQSTGSRKRHL